MGPWVGGDAEDKARTNSQPMSSLNPVRGGLFKNDGEESLLLSGYDVIGYDLETSPTREQLKEIWFTFNFVVNFLHSPAIYTEKRSKIEKHHPLVGST